MGVEQFVRLGTTTESRVLPEEKKQAEVVLPVAEILEAVKRKEETAKLLEEPVGKEVEIFFQRLSKVRRSLNRDEAGRKFWQIFLKRELLPTLVFWQNLANTLGKVFPAEAISYNTIFLWYFDPNNPKKELAFQRFSRLYFWRTRGPNQKIQEKILKSLGILPDHLSIANLAVHLARLTAKNSDVKLARFKVSFDSTSNRLKRNFPLTCDGKIVEGLEYLTGWISFPVSGRGKEEFHLLFRPYFISRLLVKLIENPKGLIATFTPKRLPKAKV